MTAGDAETPTEEYIRLQENPHVSDIPEEFSRPDEVPVWENDAYLDAVALRLMHHYDLEQDKEVNSQTVPLYGQLVIENERHVLHPALSFGYHQSTEYLFVTREPAVTEQLLEETEKLGNSLADQWVDPDTEHYSTDFTFVFVTPAIPDQIAEWITAYEHRELYKYGYHGHYEINFVAVAPDRKEMVSSTNADVGKLFQTWERVPQKRPSRIDRFLNWITR